MEQEHLITRGEVASMLFAIMDINEKVGHIVTLLKEDDDEEEEGPDA